jgi:outer membrane protein insertion porin family
MLHPFKYSLLLLLFINPVNFSQTIESINIKGNNDFSNDEITEWSGIKQGDRINKELTTKGFADSIKSRLALQFGNRGYFHSSFNVLLINLPTGQLGTPVGHGDLSPGKENLPGKKNIANNDSIRYTLNISITEGDPTYIKRIFYMGLDSISIPKIIPLFRYMEGNVYNKYDLEFNISRALSYFENSGNPFAKVIVSSVYFYSDSSSEATSGEYLADLHLDFEKEFFSKIDKVEITGNTSTKDFVVLRELRIPKGELYSQKMIDDLPKKLNRLGFFDPVNPPEFFLDSKNEGILRINVKEKETNNFDGIVGYVPSSGAGQGGYITGMVNVSLRNMFGTGRSASISWQQYDRSSQNLELKYLEPWLFNYPFNFTGGFFQRKQDSTYIQRRFEGSIEYLATNTLSAAVSLSSETVIPSQADSLIFTVFNSNSITTGANVRVDSRDDPYSPTEGLLFTTSYSFSRKKIYGPLQFITPDIPANINLQRFTLDLDLFYQLFSRQVAALGIHGRELRGSFFEISDLFRLGGANSLRGYLEDQFLGNRIFWTNIEYRLLLTNRTFGFLFLDTGYYLRNADLLRNIEKNEDFKIGYGLGFNVETGLGVLKVSFALAKGDTFSQGKIHFGIVNDF